MTYQELKNIEESVQKGESLKLKIGIENINPTEDNTNCWQLEIDYSIFSSISVHLWEMCADHNRYAALVHITKRGLLTKAFIGRFQMKGIIPYKSITLVKD